VTTRRADRDRARRELLRLFGGRRALCVRFPFAGRFICGRLAPFSSGRCPCSLGRNSQNDHQRSTARGRNLCLASSRPDRPLGVDGAEHQVSFRSLSCLTAIRAWFADVQTDARRRQNVERHLPGLARYGKKVAGGLSIAAPTLSRRRPAHEERPPDPPYDEREESRAR